MHAYTRRAYDQGAFVVLQAPTAKVVHACSTHAHAHVYTIVGRMNMKRCLLSFASPLLTARYAVITEEHGKYLKALH